MWPTMAKDGVVRATMEAMQFLIKTPHATVPVESKWGVEFPGHKMVKAAIERETAMLCQNQTAGYLSFQNGTA